jgi:hypothetical protein
VLTLDDKYDVVLTRLCAWALTLLRTDTLPTDFKASNDTVTATSTHSTSTSTTSKGPMGGPRGSASEDKNIMWDIFFE